MFPSLFTVPTSTLGLVLGVTALLAGLFLLVPVGVLFVECMCALLPARANPVGQQRPRLAVLVPAHDEEQGIAPVLKAILADLTAQDRLVVVADNCTDATADKARAAGAVVLERQDNERRGKGFALDHGLKFLDADPPEVVIVIDADCLVQTGTIERIAVTAAATGRPTQALNLLDPPAKPQPKDAVSALAFLVKNWVRPAGLHRLGFPGILTGTGMALPWTVMRSVSVASGNIVEDMQLSMDLAIGGRPALFCPGTKVIGLLPSQDKAAKSQRTRWEHGHLQTIRTQVPRLVRQALKQGRLDLFVIALDLSVPPLSLLVMMWGALVGFGLAVGFVTGVWLPLALSAAQGGLMALAIIAAWLKYGRTQLPASTLLSVPFYLMWKIPLYVAYLVRPQTKWVRTERD